MAKALGLIGNFKGKLGNTVGYSLKDSNNKQTQGVRVYQPVVRNPKTAAQAEQRCKLAPINATYRALKMVIDRGQEGKAYGNKSRLAWLKDALKAFKGGYFMKGYGIAYPSLLPLTKGSIAINFNLESELDNPAIAIEGITAAGITTIGALSIAMKNAFPALQEGDQLTFVATYVNGGGIDSNVDSIVIDSASTVNLPSFITIDEGSVEIFASRAASTAYTVVVSREGDNGAHLRSTARLVQGASYSEDVLTEAAKQAAIESYMSQGANTDWAEESLM